MKSWNSAEAKRRCASVLKGAANEPQLVQVRGKPVGVMISYDSFLRNLKAFSQKSIAGWLEELKALHEHEGDPDLPVRRDRPVAIGDDDR
jgi:prevent-host-death family protein